MNGQARVIWETLEFRTPVMLRSVASLSENQMRWHPPNSANSATWLLRHIAEVEDNRVREKVYHLPRRYRFGASVRVRDALPALARTHVIEPIRAEPVPREST